MLKKGKADLRLKGKNGKCLFFVFSLKNIGKAENK